MKACPRLWHGLFLEVRFPPDNQSRVMKILSYLFAFLLGACLGVAPAYAGNACYTPAQMQAEQLLRLHSELMVITVTCRQGSGGQDLAAAYGDFTHKNINVLHDAEQTMIAYYKNSQKGNSLDHLDRLRTILGNEFGQKVADMNAQEFCDMYRDKVLKMDAATNADVENEAQRMSLTQHAFARSCAAQKGS